MTQPCFLRGRLARLPRLLRQLRLSARGSNEMGAFISLRSLVS